MWTVFSKEMATTPHLNSTPTPDINPIRPHLQHHFRKCGKVMCGPCQRNGCCPNNPRKPILTPPLTPFYLLPPALHPIYNPHLQHHCRKCGKVVCGPCSSKKWLLPEQSTKPLRVCFTCYTQLTNLTKGPTHDVG